MPDIDPDALTVGRKDHLCAICWGPIPMGTPHVSERMYPSGDPTGATDVPWQYRAHAVCDDLWRRYGSEFDPDWAAPACSQDWQEFLEWKGVVPTREIYHA